MKISTKLKVLQFGYVMTGNGVEKVSTMQIDYLYTCDYI